MVSGLYLHSPPEIKKVPDKTWSISNKQEQVRHPWSEVAYVAKSQIKLLE